MPRAGLSPLLTRLIVAGIGLLACVGAILPLPVSASDTQQIASDRVDWQSAPVRLMMVEKHGCLYCEAWRQEIGPAYPASSEGEAAPLMVVDIDGPWPDGLVLDRRPTITPTFVLLREGEELSRLEGYPGDTFFFPLIAQMLGKAGIEAPK